jgi:predicted CXXCH cytochrome family protein
MANHKHRWALAAVVAVVAAGIGGCTDTEYIYRPFNPPVDEANGFLGYFTASTKQTSCGNCHAGVQRQWVETAHADAYATLEANPNKTASCYGCHTVSERGNALAVAAGWNAVQDTAYHDVQCENCHGPGIAHVEDPEAIQPLASIVADTGANSAGCGECHQSNHHPFVEQWRESKHGSGTAMAYAGARAECAPCHEGRAALVSKFGVQADYLEKGGTELQRISCAVCHDPHGSPNSKQLRASISEPTLENLCVTCHSRQGTPSGSTARGPHAAQGLLVFGINIGWLPPGFDYDTATTLSSHGSTANPRTCATCHVSRFTVTDQAGGFQFQSVGHSFEAIPCVDENGLPEAGPCTTAERNFTGCTQGNCHLGPGNENQVRNLYDFLINTTLNQKLDQIWTDTDGDAVIDPYPTDNGLLPKVVALGDTTLLDVRNTTLTVAEGVLWNAQLAGTHSRPHFMSGKVYVGTAGTNKAGISFSGHYTAGNGVHNPFFLEALLNASINALTKEYGLAPPADFDPVVRATPPPGLRRVSQR